MNTLGIDVSKDSFTIAAISPEGKLTAKHSCNLNPQGLSTLRKIINPNTKVAVEASGPYSSLLSAHIQTMGIRPYLVNPLLATKFKQANSLRKTKTDPIDALSIAKMAQQNPSLKPADEYQQEGIRLLERQIEYISKQIVSLKNSILQTLHFLFPELERSFNPFCKSMLNILQNFPSAKAIAKASIKQIANCISKKGRKVNVVKLKELAENSLGIPDPSREAILKSLIIQLICLLDIKQDLKDQLECQVKKLHPKEFKALLTVPGFGDLTSASFLAEVGTISRFPSSKKLTAYAGMDPAVYQSGKFVGKSHISKRGNRHLRRILYISAQQAVRFSPTFRNYFLRFRRRGRTYRQAMVATANKLLRVAYAVISSGNSFRENS